MLIVFVHHDHVVYVWFWIVTITLHDHCAFETPRWLVCTSWIYTIEEVSINLLKSKETSYTKHSFPTLAQIIRSHYRS